MIKDNMKSKKMSVLSLSLLVSLAKGFTVFYFVLLPVFYAEKLIDAKLLGYIGAVFITMVILGALVVVRWLHKWSTKTLLRTTSWIALLATLLLLTASTLKNVPLIVASYMLMGLASGTALSGINVLIAEATVKGDRFKTMAQLTMLTDVVRIIFPLFVAGAVLLGRSVTAVLIILLANMAFVAQVYRINLIRKSNTEEIVPMEIGKALHNKHFRFNLLLEFLDSLASSQLVIFVPLLFLAKGYTLESTLVLQTFVFLGYLGGRWLVSLLARRYTGLRAVISAELGMIATIILLLVVQPIALLYVLSFLLGIFTRGTSPAIKAMAFDSLDDHQVKQGSAFHVLAGDSGGALAQLIFGLLVAWFGANAPFITGAFFAGVIAVVCLLKELGLLKNE